MLPLKAMQWVQLITRELTCCCVFYTAMQLQTYNMLNTKKHQKKSASKKNKKVQIGKSVAFRYPHVVRLKAVVDSMVGGSVKDPLHKRLSALPSGTVNHVRELARSTVVHVLGTQEPVFELGVTARTVNVTTGVVSSSIPYTFGNVVDSVYFSYIFDEVQWHHGWLTYHSHYVLTTQGNTVPCVGAIDYDDGSSPSTADEVWMYDTAKFFDAVITPGYLKEVTWEVKLQGQPDMVWTTTASGPNIFWWKAVNYTAMTATSDCGELYGRFVFKFRQIKPP